MDKIQQRCLKWRTEVTLEKRDNLIICKEGENDKTLPYAVAALFVLFILSGKPWVVQSMEIVLQQLVNGTYYIWMIGADTILD